MNFGVVAEFNPFHNGHKFLIDYLKENGNNTVTAVMSESFVQRGECACLSPCARTKAALLCGVDLVLSLPVPFATASAERFAFGGVSVLGALGCVDALAFGAENANAENLKKCAEILTSEDFSGNLEKYLDQGLSFPVARQKALEISGGKELSDVLLTPNNILGVEYIKAINKLDLNMEIFPVGRKGAAHDSSVSVDNISSASAIRGTLEKGCSVKRFLPEPSYSILREETENGKAPADYKTLETAILYKLRSMSAEDLRELPDVSEGLEYRFIDGIRTSASLDEILEKVKTKRYTHSRLRRIVLCALLGIKKEDVLMNAPYIRVLGFNEKGAQLLKTAKETASLPVITKFSETEGLDDGAKRVFALECFARDVFSLALPKADFCGKEMTDKIVTV